MYWYNLPDSSWVHVKTMYTGTWYMVLVQPLDIYLVHSWHVPGMYTSGMYLIHNMYFLSTYWVPIMCLVSLWYLHSTHLVFIRFIPGTYLVHIGTLLLCTW